MSLSQGELLDRGLHQLLPTVLADLQVRPAEDQLRVLRFRLPKPGRCAAFDLLEAQLPVSAPSWRICVLSDAAVAAFLCLHKPSPGTAGAGDLRPKLSTCMRSQTRRRSSCRA